MTKDEKERVKQETIRLYESLPQIKSERIARLDVRDRVIELNYAFFGYVATKTFINNSMVTYEDKLQSALMHFCECWWWWKWNGDETHKGYRGDISFAVFFKPRVGEMIERELNEVKYSVRRSLCMEVGEQLGKHWGQVKYDDLANVNLPPEKMIALKAIFGTLYSADLSEHELFIEAPSSVTSSFEVLDDKYDSIQDLLLNEMITYEEKLTDSKLLDMAEMYGVDYRLMKAALPKAEKILYDRLKESQDIRSIWEPENS